MIIYKSKIIDYSKNSECATITDQFSALWIFDDEQNDELNPMNDMRSPSNHKENNLLVAIRNEPKAYRQVISSYKTERCEDEKWTESLMCKEVWIKYHTSQDRRRSPIIDNYLAYSDEMCEFVKNGKDWPKADAWNFSHNNIEVDFHPIRFKTQDWNIEKDGKWDLGINWSKAHSNEIKRDGKLYYRALFLQLKDIETFEEMIRNDASLSAIGPSNLLHKVRSPPKSISSPYKGYAQTRFSFNYK